MRNTVFPRLYLSLIALALLAAVVSRSHAADPKPPAGFVALFNGKDLCGWHGMPHFDPYELAAMTEAQRKAKIEEWTAGAKKHWTVDKGELVNDGNGAYLTTDKDYGDIELLVEYKTVPLADSGIYLASYPQVQIWDYTKEGGKWNLGADKGSGGLWNNSPARPAKIPRAGRQAVRPVEHLPHPHGRRAGHGLSQRQARGRSRPAGELLEPRAAAAAERPRSSCRHTAARSAGATCSSAKSRPTRPTRSCASTARAGFESVFNGKDFDRLGRSDRSI